MNKGEEKILKQIAEMLRNSDYRLSESSQKEVNQYIVKIASKL